MLRAIYFWGFINIFIVKIWIKKAPYLRNIGFCVYYNCYFSVSKIVLSEVWLEKTTRAVRFNIMAATKDSNINIMWNFIWLDYTKTSVVFRDIKINFGVWAITLSHSVWRSLICIKEIGYEYVLINCFWTFIPYTTYFLTHVTKWRSRQFFTEGGINIAA
jgi:hypothetical protein